MTYGRKDYFWGVAPEKSVFGELQTQWRRNSANNVASGASASIGTYTVSAGYLLQIDNIQISCNKPGMQYFYLKINSIIEIVTWFDTTLNIAMGEGGNLIVNGGEAVEWWFQNNDGITVGFVQFSTGFLQQTIV